MKSMRENLLSEASHQQDYLISRMANRQNGQTEMVVLCNGGSLSSEKLDQTWSEGNFELLCDIFIWNMVLASKLLDIFHYLSRNAHYGWLLMQVKSCQALSVLWKSWVHHTQFCMLQIHLGWYHTLLTGNWIGFLLRVALEMVHRKPHTVMQFARLNHHF